MTETNAAVEADRPLKVTLVRLSRQYGEMLACQPLGLMFLASWLRFRGGHAVRILDMKLGDRVWGDFEADLAERRPDIVGLGAMTYESSVIPRAAALARKLCPDAAIMVGGAHASVFAEETLAVGEVDFVVRGEGEATAEELLDALTLGRSPGSVAGIGYRDRGEPVFTGPRAPILDMDRMPFPAWDLIDVPAYYRLPRAGIVRAEREYGGLFTSRACGCRCIYCHNIFGSRFRARSPESVFEEMRILCARYGVREFQILDDSFAADPDRAKQICRLIIERGMKVKLSFPNGIRGDRLDNEAIELLVGAGMYRAQFSVETGSPRMQAEIRKHLDLPRIKRNIAYASRLGALTHGAFMIGFPGETREEMLRTVRFALRSRLETAAFYRVIPFKGTELYERVRDALPPGDLDNYEYYTFDINLSEATDAEVTRIQRTAYIRFNLSPRRMLRLVWRLPHKLQLLEMFLVFVRRVLRR